MRETQGRTWISRHFLYRANSPSDVQVSLPPLVLMRASNKIQQLWCRPLRQVIRVVEDQSQRRFDRMELSWRDSFHGTLSCDGHE